MFVIMILTVVIATGLPVWGQVGAKFTPVFQGKTTIIDQPIQFPRFRNQVTAVLGEIAPGGEIGRHQHPVPAITYVLEGTVTVEIEGSAQRVFTAGQAYLEPVDAWHNAFNRGTTPVKVLAIFAGEVGKSIIARPPGGTPVGLKVTPVFQGSETTIGQPILFPLFNNQVTAQLAEFAPGGETGRHQHPVPTFVYVLEGTITTEVEGHGQKVQNAGQAVLEVINTWHNGSNRGTTPAKALGVFFGQEGTPNFIRPK